MKRHRKEIGIPLSQTKILLLSNAQLKEVFCDKRMFNIVSVVSNVKNASGMFSENEIVTKKQKTEAENITNKFSLAPS